MKFKWDYLHLIVVFLLAVGLWWPTKNWPAFWDGLGYVLPSAYEINQNGFRALSSKYTDFAHPPIVPIIAAWGLRLTPNSNLGWHALMFGFSLTLLLSLYGILRRYTTSLQALLGTVALGVAPVIIAETANLYLDLPAASLMLSSIALILWNKKIPSIILLSLMVLTKFTLLPVIFVHWFLLNKKERWWLLIPLGILVGWLGIHWYQTGWILTRPGRQMLLISNIAELFSRFGFVVKAYLGVSLIHIVAGLGFLSWVLGNKVNLKLDQRLKILIIAVIVSIAEFVLIGEMAARYALGFTLILSLVSLIVIRERKYLFLVTCGLLGVVNILGLFKNFKLQDRYEFSAPDDGRYISMLAAFRELGAWASIQPETITWYVGFPENLAFQKPEYGYVTRIVKQKLCNEFQYDPNQTQYVVVHPYSPSSAVCRQLLEKTEMKLYRRIERKDAWIEIYEVVKTETGSKK